MLPKRPFKSYKICNKIFEHGFEPPPFWTVLKKMRIWWRVAPLIFHTNICITKYTNSPTLCTQSAQKPPTWHIPPSIYPIPKYIFKLQYSQMIGSLHLIPTYIFNLQIFPKCWPYRSNTNMFITKCTFPKFAPSNRHASPDCLQIISKTCWIGVSKYCCKF